MERRQINSLSGIDIPSLGIEDIRFMYGTGISEPDGFGRQKKRSLRNGVQTQIGDIREDLWYQLAEQVIGLHGETWLLGRWKCGAGRRCIIQGMALICTRRRWSCTVTGYSTVRDGLITLHSIGGSGQRWWRGVGSPG